MCRRSESSNCLSPAAAASAAANRPSLARACRHRTLALCCRRWRSLACSPELLRSVSASLPDMPAFLQQVHSLCSWLVQRAAPHMTRLQLRLHAFNAAPEWGDGDGELWRLEFTTTLAATLAACGTHGRLTELSLELGMHCSFFLGSWMAPLAGLRRLTVTLGDGIIVATGSLRCLPALRHLSLQAFPYAFRSSVVWEAGSALPPSLTSLCLGGEDKVRVLPPQVRTTALGRLRVGCLEEREHWREQQPCSPSAFSLFLPGAPAAPSFDRRSAC